MRFATRSSAWTALGWMVCATTALAASASAERQAQQQAQAILAATGVQGGVVLHLGCGDGRLTAALRASDSFLVHGLDADAANVQAARQHIQHLGLYGPVFVEQWRGGQLPYIDNSVNLVVGRRPDGLSDEEILRVLAPNGVAYLEEDGQWRKLVKPWPDGADEWTHYLHDPANNAVSQDRLIEPLARYQWVGSPRYSRHHDHMSAISAVVSAKGRVFYIVDEAPRALILPPPRWRLVARDAFNGAVLWERPIDRWHTHLWRLKSGPQLLARRLVADGDRVFVTMSIDGPLSELNAATGETIRTYTGTEGTEEILYSEGVLLLSVAGSGQPLRWDPDKQYETVQAIAQDVTDPLWTVAPRTIMAVDAETGKVLWRKRDTMLSLSLAAAGRRVLYHDGDRLHCLDRADGSLMWSSPPLPRKDVMRSSGGATVVIYKDVVLYSGQAPAGRGSRATQMFALSLQDGRILWQAEHPPCGHMGTPDDILVAGGLVWVGEVAQGSQSGVMIGRDPHTGEVKSQFLPDVETHWFHHRCYRAKATEKYLLFSRTGIEFIDYAQEHWIPHHWVRGACHYGIMPANGLVYAPQHPCACYLEAKLFGFTALAPPADHLTPRREIPDAERLERGPAYKAPLGPANAAEDQWPTYRGDAGRSGATKAAAPVDGLRRSWRVGLGGRLSSPVVAGRRLYVASIDAHTVHCLDADTGQRMWSFTAGGRVDSPPTVWRGRVLFGSADGYVYCLRANDGQLAWRYRAAPENRRMGAMEQVESVWPVHGSVLVQNDVLYTVAGRSMFLDGGLRFLRLDPKTGKKLSETILDDKDPETHQNLQVHVTGLNMPVALPDVLSSDGRYVYMRSLPFDLEGNRKFVSYIPVDQQEGDDVHLFSPTGLLDDSLWHRTYWLYGRAWASGAGGYYQAGRRVPAGRILVYDETNVYGFGRKPQYYRWTTPLEFELFGASKRAPVEPIGQEKKPVKKNGKRVGTRIRQVTRFVPKWTQEVPVQVNALALASNVLLAAGPPDVEDEEQSARSLNSPETQRKLVEQQAALEGRRGGVLVAVSPEDGQLLASYRLESMPRFDGLIVALGRLYVTTADGNVLCLGDQFGQPLPRP